MAPTHAFGNDEVRDAEITALRAQGDAFIAAWSAAPTSPDEPDEPDEPDDESDDDDEDEDEDEDDEYDDEDDDAVAFRLPGGPNLWLPPLIECDTIGELVWSNVLLESGLGARWEEVWHCGDVYWVASQDRADDGSPIEFIGRFDDARDAMVEAARYLDWTAMGDDNLPGSTYTLPSAKWSVQADWYPDGPDSGMTWTTEHGWVGPDGRDDEDDDWDDDDWDDDDDDDGLDDDG